MATLRLRVPLGVGETPTSFCSRLARRNGCKSANEFCQDMGVPISQVAAGVPSALRKLAELGGVRPDTLQSGALRRVGRDYFCRDQHFLMLTIDRARLRVCPACIIEDGERWAGYGDAAPFERMVWIPTPIRTCAVHSLDLVEIIGSASLSKLPPPMRNDFSSLVRPFLPKLGRLLAKAPRSEPSSLECYLLGRLGAASFLPGSWLDDLPFYAVARASEMIGTILTKGPRARVSEYTEADWRASGEAGFSLLNRGLADLRIYFDNLWHTEIEHGYGVGARAFLGEVYQWLERSKVDSCYDRLRELVRESILSTFAMGPDENIFGKPVGERRFHSVHSAAKELDMSPKRLRGTLYAAGLISEADLQKTNEKTLFNADARGNEFLELFRTALPHKLAASYLNVARPQFDLLIEHRFITPIVGKIGTVKDRGFAKRNLDAFLAALHERVTEEMTGEAPSIVDIAKASKHAHCSSIRVLNLILNGQLKHVYRRIGQSGFRSILVDRREVASIVLDRTLPGSAVKSVAEETSLGRSVVEALAVSGLLASQIMPHPFTGRPHRRIDRASLDKFTRDFISLSNLAKDRGKAAIHLRTKLKSLGIKPAFDRELIGATFYKRGEVMKLDL